MPMTRIILGTRKGLIILATEGDKWNLVSESFAGSHVSIAFVDPRSGNLFACLDDGHFGNKLFRWNGFATDKDWQTSATKEKWVEIECPKYPEGSKLPNGNDAVTKYLWAMAAGGPDQEGRIYVGTEPGGLFISDDHGDTFRLCQALWDHPSRTAEAMPWFGGGRDEAGIHSVCVDPRNPNHIRVGISCAGVFLSEDAGESWIVTNKGMKADFLPDPESDVGQDPHLVAQCESFPDVIWNQNHCGIYRSENAGQLWEFVSEKDGPAHFGFAIALDPKNPDVAWVVPAQSDMVRCAVERKLCVCRTDDGGKTWQAFREGLPQEDCFDFALRHCLIHHENQVAFGTACGSLYLSENRGESWKSLGQHFPPIYCVVAV